MIPDVLHILKCKYSGHYFLMRNTIYIPKTSIYSNRVEKLYGIILKINIF